MTLTPKQQRFVDEYTIDSNATQAAIRAGYSERTARQQGARLVTNVDIAATIEVGRADGGLDIFGIGLGRLTEGEGGDAVGQEEHDLACARPWLAVGPGESGQLDHRELDRRGEVRRAVGTVAQDLIQGCGYAREVAGEWHLHQRVVLI